MLTAYNDTTVMPCYKIEERTLPNNSGSYASDGANSKFESIKF